MTGYSIHYIKANCYRFRVTDWSWRKLPIYVHRCPTHQCMYAYVSSNLRTRRRQVIHLESSKDGHPLERKDFVHSRNHCSACLVHGVDAIRNAAAKVCICFLSRLLRMFKNEPQCWTQMILLPWSSHTWKWEIRGFIDHHRMTVDSRYSSHETRANI
jgi:hypothetical protein